MRGAVPNGVFTIGEFSFEAAVYIIPSLTPAMGPVIPGKLMVTVSCVTGAGAPVVVLPQSARIGASMVSIYGSFQG